MLFPSPSAPTDITGSLWYCKMLTILDAAMIAFHPLTQIKGLFVAPLYQYFRFFYICRIQLIVLDWNFQVTSLTCFLHVVISVLMG